MRRWLIVAAVLLAFQLAATVYGYLPLAKFRFRNISGTEPPGWYVGNEWFAWQVVDWRPSPTAVGSEKRIRFLGVHAGDVPGICQFVRLNVLWTIVPNVVWLGVVGRRYHTARRAWRAADPSVDRGFAIESVKPIPCCPTCGQRLPTGSIEGVASGGRLP